MKTLKFSTSILISLFLMMGSSSGYAQKNNGNNGKGSNAQRLGSFAGAMKYCERMDPARSSRYSQMRRNVAGEVDGMSNKEKNRAISARDRTYDSGQYLGRRLDRQGCQSLLRQTEWNRYQ